MKEDDALQPIIYNVTDAVPLPENVTNATEANLTEDGEAIANATENVTEEPETPPDIVPDEPQLTYFDDACAATCMISGFGSKFLRGQRVFKRQPSGGSIALGTTPSNRTCFCLAVGSGIGTADSKASVYG